MIHGLTPNKTVEGGAAITCRYFLPELKTPTFISRKRLRMLAARLTATLGGVITMNETDFQIEWQDGSGESVEIGYFDPHGQ